MTLGKTLKPPSKDLAYEFEQH